MSKQGQTAHTVEGQEVFAAGVPWFVTLFGHDSLITALQTLAYNPGITEETLRLLASYRGQHLDEWREAQSGKIPHELRVGKMARWGEIPTRRITARSMPRRPSP